MGFVSWLLAHIIILIVFVGLTFLMSPIRDILQGNIIECFPALISLFLALFFIGPWTTDNIYDLLNKCTSPKRQFRKQKRPISFEYRIIQNCEVRFTHWERGWGIWLNYIIIAAVWVYIVFFANS